MNYIFKQPMQYGYVQISNDICNDQRVSDTAFAIYGFIKQHATTFKLTVASIAKRFNKSLPTVYKYLNQLKDLGYLEFERPRNSDGTFTKFLRFFIANHAKTAYVNPTSHQQRVLKWIKPPKQGSNAEDNEAQSILKPLSAYNNKKNKNKHEHIRAHEEFSHSEAIETHEVFQDQEDFKNPHENSFSFKSQISDPGLFARFKGFLSSILGNLDTKGLDPTERLAFEEFLNYRNEKHKISYSTKKALLEQCLSIKAQGEDLVFCIKQSIRRNYNEIYARMHFEKPYKSEAQKRNEEVMSYFDCDFKPNPKYNGYCIW
ncbi:helix-turn-helix domain-containing protein [Helicobacter acinonychis]|uniref:helix-turn-helix domain-containing protein n=1 Tax=Helicobacter acinonychis TaxID=212 RepID=UPI000CF08C71|nr:helix-turn-helix domain-containing protein [Helicobacter acinonychis]